MFIAAGAATQAKGLLYRMQPSRTGQAPNWDGHGGGITPHEVSSPITDKSYWEGRYVLCELTLRKQDGQTLVINDAVCAISRAKNIVTTQMVGMDGTVKEYINEGDYQINIVVGVAAVRNGVIVDEYPEDGLRELRAFSTKGGHRRAQRLSGDIRHRQYRDKELFRIAGHGQQLPEREYFGYERRRL